MRDLLVILAVVLLVFGAKKLRTIGPDLGAAVRSFKKAMARDDPAARPGQVGSERPDAEFPEMTASRQGERDSAR